MIRPLHSQAFTQENESVRPYRNLHTNVHSSFSIRAKKMETIWMPINRLMNKQIEVYPYNGGILLSNKNNEVLIQTNA